MKPGWIAGVTRARLLVSRGIGPQHATEIARAPSLGDALAGLAGSAYGERVRSGQDLAIAQRGVAETLLWHLRILAGWLPAAGAALVRTLAGWFELVNIDARLAALASDGREPPPFVLGTLATAWGAVEGSRTIEEVANAVADSGWRVHRGSTASELALGLRVAWARRIQDSVPQAADWVAGAGALLVARELLVARTRGHAAQLLLYPGIDEQVLAAGSLPELSAAVGPRAGWALSGIGEPTDLWQAEIGWWDRVEDDALGLLRHTDDEVVVLAAVALLAVDAQRTARALQSAAHGAGGAATEISPVARAERFDATA
ncbi:MAG: hypothetical protein ACXVEW_05840 [Solirubrobacteraceae bacterium]